MDNAIKEVVESITDSYEYKECVRIKELMESNEEISDRVKRIKLLQKKYIRTNDSDIKCELERLEKELNDIPIYNTYMQYLSIVNDKINYITDEVNDYFYKLFNEG